jgi:uncharacterized protein YdhG (YjbR/CyaY superfamily)
MRYNSHEEYITSFPLDIQLKLRELQSYLVEQLPSGCEEVISYNMPAFKLKKVIVYFAAHKEHIGFYPTSKPIEVFKHELKNFKFSRGAIQFAYNQPLPKNLIKNIIEFRVKDLDL